ncbi:MAG: hypothetical protein JHC57_02020 [Sphingopyxis sp.]|uniref:EF-hand domain-containing protein n=1 Tax=Sphingopyxis sp. TaxID=1908224 RepID=UPI001A355513|nr:hypothetical protein [Sphingopyxis sp.]MBJ7498511.1 hypothetical protein [Sphingopyxis sp.]
MNRKIVFLTLGAALVAAPVLAAPGGADRNATQTRAEVQTKAAEMFARMDVNKDGKLDAADRAAKRAEMQAKMFERLDADKDGSISKAEWDQHGADRAAKRGEKRADAGAAGEGKRHGMRGHHGKRGGHHGMMMGKADTDGDKAISQAEFQTAALARFDAADANKDGQVTPEERKAQRGAWRAKRGGTAPAAPAGE